MTVELYFVMIITMAEFRCPEQSREHERTGSETMTGIETDETMPQ
jgi:hypothetical protein